MGIRRVCLATDPGGQKRVKRVKNLRSTRRAVAHQVVAGYTAPESGAETILIVVAI